jgi:hypothetical protein
VLLAAETKELGKRTPFPLSSLYELCRVETFRDGNLDFMICTTFGCVLRRSVTLKVLDCNVLSMLVSRTGATKRPA